MKSGLNPGLDRSPLLRRPGEMATHASSVYSIFRLLAAHFIQNRFTQTAKTHALSSKCEDDNLVPSLLEVRSGHIERLLRTDIPEAAERMAVDPDRTFAPSACVQEGITERLQIEVTLIEGRSDGSFGGLHSGEGNF